MPISVLLAVHRLATRSACVDALRRDDDVRVVGLAANALEALGHVLTLRPRVVVLEATLGARTLVPFLEVVRVRSPRSRVLVVGARRSRPRIVDLVAHGAHGHLHRQELRARLRGAVRALASGENWISRKLVSNVLSRLADCSRRRPLSDRAVRRAIGPSSTRRGCPRR